MSANNISQIPPNKEINEFIDSLEDLKIEFAANWVAMSQSHLTLGLATDMNSYKKNMLEILNQASNERDLILTKFSDIFYNGLSKLEHELDDSDTLEKIKKQFDDLIFDLHKSNIEELENKYLFSSVFFEGNSDIEAFQGRIESFKLEPTNNSIITTLVDMENNYFDIDLREIDLSNINN